MIRMGNDVMYLRTWQIGDGEILYNLNSNPEVLKYTGDEPFVNVEAANKFVTRYKDFEHFGCGRWMVVLKENDEAIGWCGVKYHKEEDYYDLGFRLFQEHWHKGYAYMASKMVLNFSREYMDVHEMTARAMSGNIASIKLLKKLGFLENGSEIEGEVEWVKFRMKL